MFDYLSKAGITQLLTAIKGKFAAASHTHNYAGSSSSGGSATSAVKLTTSAGSATEPVYFSGGKPVKCSHTLEADVPSDAVFTDTVYSLPVASSTLGGVKTTSSVTSTSGLTACPIISGVPYYKDTNTTYGVVSTTANGLCPKRGGTTTKFLRDDGTWAVPELDESVLSGYLPLTGGMTTGTTGLAGNFRVYVGEFTRIQFLLNGQWVTVISGDNTNNGIIVGNLGLEKAAFNVDDPSHAYVNSYPIYSAGYKPYKTASFGKASASVTIDCGFKPSYVVIFCDTPSTYIYSTGVSIVFTLNNTGFVVSADIPSGKYSYIAFR